MDLERTPYSTLETPPSYSPPKGEDGLSVATRDIYRQHRDLWVTFSVSYLKSPFAQPTLVNLQKFVWWEVKRSKGLIGDKITFDTLMFRLNKTISAIKRLHNACSPMGAVGDLRDYVTSNSKELGIEDTNYVKEIMTWNDVVLVIRFLVAYDKHNYRDESLRYQIVWVFLLIADGGERPGAIMQSEAYRHEATSALCYDDVQLFMRPGKFPFTEPPTFKLRIRYHNRKGARREAKNFLEQTYFTRSDTPHCVVFWFLFFAFRDNAFQSVSTPAELFQKRNISKADTPILFKKIMRRIPILRKMLQDQTMSPNRPWPVSAATYESQRVLRAMGSEQRFSFYCIRRGVVNCLADSPHISASRRKQLVGHDGTSDAIFRKYYQSKIFNLDTGNIYRQEEIRPEKADDLCMRHNWDPSCPNEISREEAESLYQADETLKILQAGGDASAVYKRRAFLRRTGLRALREKHFKSKEEFGLESLPTVDQLSSLTELNEQSVLDGRTLDDLVTDRGFNINKMDVNVKRAAVYKALYPDGVAGGSAQQALEAALANHRTSRLALTSQQEQLLVELRLKQGLTWTAIFDHFPNRTGTMLRSAYDRLLDQDPSLAEAETKLVVQRPTLARFDPTPDEVALLLRLRNNQNVKWAEIPKYFPGYSKGQLIHRYRELSRTEQPVYTLTSEELGRVALLRISKKTWPQIADEFPNHDIRGLKQAFALETSKFASLPSRKRRSTSSHSGEKQRKISPESPPGRGLSSAPCGDSNTIPSNITFDNYCSDFPTVDPGNVSVELLLEMEMSSDSELIEWNAN